MVVERLEAFFNRLGLIVRIIFDLLLLVRVYFQKPHEKKTSDDTKINISFQSSVCLTL